MKIVKKTIITLIFFVTIINSVFAIWWKDDIKNGLLNNQENTIITGVETVSTDWKLTVVDTIFKFVKDSISGLLLVMVIWVFLFMWMRLVLARWNPEELKKTMIQFVYVAIWMFVVSIAWAIVKLVSWLSI
jgi:hypothetical protein